MSELIYWKKILMLPRPHKFYSVKRICANKISTYSKIKNFYRNFELHTSNDLTNKRIYFQIFETNFKSLKQIYFQIFETNLFQRQILKMQFANFEYLRIIS